MVGKEEEEEKGEERERRGPFKPFGRGGWGSGVTKVGTRARRRVNVSQRKKGHDAYVWTLGSRSEPTYAYALQVMSSHAGEKSMAPYCVPKIPVIELKELIAKHHAYALDPSDLQLLAECRRSALVYDRSYNCVQAAPLLHGRCTFLPNTGLAGPRITTAKRDRIVGFPIMNAIEPIPIFPCS